MKNQTQVVVIGGGVIGCSILYHLTEMGWDDVVLVEKNELTSGSTWLAAGNTVFFGNNRNLNRIQQYCVEKAKTLEAETGQATGWHETGSLRLAYDEVRMDEFRHVAAKDQAIGVTSRLVDLDEMKELYPLLDTKNLIGGLYHEGDGHVDPAGLTHAFAKGARQKGAEIYLTTTVTGFIQKEDDTWVVQTDKGDIACTYVVNAAGLWAKQLGEMVGLDLPIIAMEHQHLLFEDLHLLEDLGRELPSLRDPDISYYLRQEQMGMLIGPYETGGVPWRVDGVENSYAAAELPPDIDRISEIMADCLERVPALQDVGVKHLANGPITYTPDGAPLVGPAFGLKNFFLASGFSYGITLAAGVGKCMAEWIVDGEPEWDILYMHPQRFGAYATKEYTVEKIQEVYRMEYALAYPHEQREAGRPLKTSPIYNKQAAAGAKFGCLYGWERPEWFAPEGMEPVDDVTFRRANFFGPVGDECKAVQERAGLLDLTGFSKFEVTGPGAFAFLDKLVCGRVPGKDGRTTVTQMLTPKGHIHTDATITRFSEEQFYVVTAAWGERHDYDWMEKYLPEDGSVTIENVTYRYGALVLAGPKARDIMKKLTSADLSNESFPFLGAQHITVAKVPLRAMRLNFVGELGWELHHPIEQQHVLYDALLEAGEEFGLKLFGIRAMNSMRIEKGYGAWGTEFTPDITPLEAGLERFVRFEKGDFIGKEALLKVQEVGTPKKLVSLVITGTEEADPYLDEPLFHGDDIVGRVSSGAYGYRTGASVALAFIKTDVAKVGTKLEINILGKRYPAEIVQTPIYDPANAKLKS